MEATKDSTATPAATKAAELAALAAELVNSAETRAREDVARRIGLLIADAAKGPPAEAKPPAEYPLGFTATAGSMYALSTEATRDDVHTQLSARLSHLCALLAMTYGAGYQAFRMYGETTQENYLWTCSSLANECDELLVALDERHREELEAKAL